jgi:NhaP-type Na+/H+ or K+/H+ antiporter
VVLALALATTQAGDGGWLGAAFTDLAIAVLVGGTMGALGGRALALAVRAGWTTPTSGSLVGLSLALGSYLVSVGIGGNGFVAAFVGGIAFGVGTRNVLERELRVTEVLGNLLAVVVWVIFGLSVAGPLLVSAWDPAALVYAVLALTLLRMLPVAIALARQRFHPATVVLIGWFGPRGLASIVFLLVALETLHREGVAVHPVAAVVGWTVLLSVVLHGLSARPLAGWYGRVAGRLSPRAPELEPAEDDEQATERMTVVPGRTD